MFSKIVLVLLVVFAFLSMTDAACLDTIKTEYCKVFEPFCGDSRYSDITQKCAATCKVGC